MMQDRRTDRELWATVFNDPVYSQDREEALHQSKLWAQHHLNLKAGFWVIDTETTGVDRQTREIVQVAGLHYPSGDHFLYHCLPQLKPSPGAVEVTGLSIEVLRKRNAQSWAYVHQAIWPRLAHHAVVAYNAPFDYGAFVTTNSIHYTANIPFASWGCAMLAYSPHHGEWNPKYHNWRWAKLAQAVADQNLPAFDAHDAMEDVRATLNLVLWLGGRNNFAPPIQAIQPEEISVVPRQATTTPNDPLSEIKF